jgi:ABC-type sugar transport system substrate-binding protein
MMHRSPNRSYFGGIKREASASALVRFYVGPVGSVAKGNVILLRYLAGSESTEQREQGFLDGLKDYPDITVVSSDQQGGDTATTAKEKVDQLHGAPYPRNVSVSLRTFRSLRTQRWAPWGNIQRWA